MLRSNAKVKVGSLFSGIGGIDLGLERAGMEIKWQCEIDAFCRDVLAMHWPTVPKYRDIREIDWNAVERVDVIAGGFPCQPISIAGKGLGRDDPRWLWPEFARCIRSLRPRFMLMENVSGLLGRGMGDILGDLAASGYACEWQSIPAAAFGAPHIRERVWLVAYPNKVGPAQGKIFDRKPSNGRGNLQAPWSIQNTRLVSGNSGRVFIVPNTRNGGMADGISGRLERFGALGNAVVPAVVQWVGERIVDGTWIAG